MKELGDLILGFHRAPIVLDDDAFQASLGAIGKVTAAAIVFNPNRGQLIEITAQAKHGAGALKGLGFGTGAGNFRAFGLAIGLTSAAARDALNRQVADDAIPPGCIGNRPIDATNLIQPVLVGPQIGIGEGQRFGLLFVDTAGLPRNVGGVKRLAQFLEDFVQSISLHGAFLPVKGTVIVSVGNQLAFRAKQ